MIETLRRHLEGDTVLCLPSAWTIASLKTAPSEELAANRVEDLTLGFLASLAGAPQVSILVVTDSYAIGLGLRASPSRRCSMRGRRTSIEPPTLGLEVGPRNL